jgi:hypothetical protein
VRSCSWLDAHQEDEAEFANLNFVATSEPLIVNADPIYVGAIEGTNIAHAPAIRPPTEFSMPTADRYVVQEHVGLRGTAHAYNVGICGEKELAALRRSAMNDEERRARGQFPVNTAAQSRGRSCAGCWSRTGNSGDGSGLVKLLNRH